MSPAEGCNLNCMGRQLLTLTVLRKEKGLTQWELAEHLNVTQTEISLLENGHVSTIRNDGLRRIAELLGIDEGEVLLPYAEFIAGQSAAV